MLSAKGVSLGRGGQVILDGVSLSVGPRTRLGLVGPNGIGKSTLLRVLAGLEVPDAGQVERLPATLRVGYLAQEPDAQTGETLLAYLARRTGVARAEAELDRWTAALASGPTGAPAGIGEGGPGTSGIDPIEGYSDALDRFLALGGDDFAGRAASVCDDLGLPQARLAVPVGDLSGGQAARAGLAAILLARFEVFLLDEPTNDLDFAGLDRLEGFLNALPGAVVVVSHDRAFLDRAVDRIAELEEHTHIVTEYAGAWSEYVARRALARSHQSSAYQEWQAERARLSQRIKTQRSWSEQGVRSAKKPSDHDRAQRGFFVNRTEKQASKVRSSEKALVRLGEMDKPWEGWQLQLDLAPSARSGDVVARLEGAVVTRGDFSLGPVDLEIGWQDRVAIMGPNGSGKSTLLGAILGRLPLAAGRRWLGPGVQVGELDQRRGRLVGADTLLAGFVADTGVLPEEARSTLAKFGLGAGHVGRPVERLSPGERTRALLAALMVSGTNCLVLDEPTNHLDLPAIEQLEAALESFEGTLLMVTHDRWLLESVEVSRTVEVVDGAVVEQS